MVSTIATILRDKFLNIVASWLEQLEYGIALDPNYVAHWAFGILIEKAILRISLENMKQKNRRERESSF